MIVWQIASFGIPAQARDGVAAHLVYVPVVIEENVERNRSGGAGIQWERLLQHGLEALSGRHQDGLEFQMYDPAWQNLGKIDGVNRVVLNILCTSYVKPLGTSGSV